MSDESVAAALRSSAPLVVVEAPAGCGKTFQGAQYARAVAPTLGDGRLLILTHTHAACDVFASRTAGVSSRVEIRTIDSLISQIASAYHRALDLPADAGAWARSNASGYDILASKVAALFRASPMITKALAQRYPVIICDEHQDACAERHAVVLAHYSSGAKLRVFGDPMQRIYGEQTNASLAADRTRWNDLKERAGAFEELDHPHRWANTNADLGAWILRARAALAVGQPIDLRVPLPRGIKVFVGENMSVTSQKYMLGAVHGGPIRNHVRDAASSLVVARRNTTVASLVALFGRRYPIWEGHTREAFSGLVAKIQEHRGNPRALGEAVVSFVSTIAVGFTTAFSRDFLDEIIVGCAKPRRGLPGRLQDLARLILDEPDHRGVSRMLQRLSELISSEKPFDEIKIDHRREFQEAMRLQHYEDADECFAEQARRRTFSRPMPPSKSISTIHKAKGLEFGDVVVMPCDRAHFGNTMQSRCLLYVAISRATTSLTFVVSDSTPSPLIQR